MSILMDSHVEAVARAVTVGSDEERISFPAVVKALMDVGVERYHADLVCATKTYYMPDGAFVVVDCHDVPRPATDFSAAGVEAAVRSIQVRRIGYRAFCEAIAAAGCVGYFVTMAGQRTIYYGRTGESHTELFPATP